MARAGRALKRVLEGYGISQNQLATTMGIDRSNVSRWVSGSRDPSAEAVAEIKRALSTLRAQAAEDFVQYYLYEDLGSDPSRDREISVASGNSFSNDVSVINEVSFNSGMSIANEIPPSMHLLSGEVQV